MTAGCVYCFHVGTAKIFYFGMNQSFLKTPVPGVSNYLTAHPHYETAPGSQSDSACQDLDLLSQCP